jgi:hypothetical protein
VDDFEGRSEQCRKLIKEIKRSGETEVLDDYIEMMEEMKAFYTAMVPLVSAALSMGILIAVKVLR